MTQCKNCRYCAEVGIDKDLVCLVAWDGDDELKTCLAVERILFDLAEAFSCPSFATKNKTVVDGLLVKELVVV